MHTMSRPISVSRHGSGFRVTACRGWVNPARIKDFAAYNDAMAYAQKLFATKYYASACIIDETPAQDAAIIANTRKA